LLQKSVNYGGKKFNSTLPGLKCPSRDIQSNLFGAFVSDEANVLQRWHLDFSAEKKLVEHEVGLLEVEDDVKLAHLSSTKKKKIIGAWSKYIHNFFLITDASLGKQATALSTDP